MRKSDEKKKIVEDLVETYGQLNVERLYNSPDHTDSKAWLSEIAAILKNLDETDFQAFLNHRQHLYPSIPVNTRKHAAEQIDGFVRQKVAEYQRYDFRYLDKKNLEEPDKDLLTIKRDGLLKKKRLLDAVEKLRQQSKEGQKEFQTNCFYLAGAVGVDEWNPFMDVLRSVENKDVVSFEVDDDFHHGDPWGNNPVILIVGKKFAAFSKKIREYYHESNKKLGRDEETRSSKSLHVQEKKPQKRWWDQTWFQIIMLLGAIAGITGLILIFIL